MIESNNMPDKERAARFDRAVSEAFESVSPRPKRAIFEDPNGPVLTVTVEHQGQSRIKRFAGLDYNASGDEFRRDLTNPVREWLSKL
jgi:hypothetical protein